MRDRARPSASATDAEAGRILIACASLVGDQFSSQVLAACCDAPQESVDRVLQEACRSGLLVAQDGNPTKYRFRHALSRAAIRGDLDSATACSLHARIAATLERLPHLKADTETIEYHWNRAGKRRHAQRHRKER